MNIARYLLLAIMSVPAVSHGSDNPTVANRLPVSNGESPARSHRHPDWTGVWVRIGSLSDPRVKHDGREAPPSPTDESDWPPLTDAFRDRYRTTTQALEKGERLNDPTANCLPAGFPWMMNMPYPMEIHQTALQVTIIAEWMSQTRRIYVDANHPKDIDPTFFGDSIGHWETNVLVVDTVGLRSDTNMNDSGLMHGKHTHVIERWSQGKDGVLDDELTVFDNEMLTRPWVRTFQYRREPSFRLMEYVCENNRDYAPRAITQP
jgi:hypothetical protein